MIHITKRRTDYHARLIGDNAKNELKQIAMLSERRFGNYYHYDPVWQLYANWHDARRDLFDVILTEGEIVGFNCVLPLRDNSKGREHLEKKIPISEISASHFSDKYSTIILYAAYHIDYRHLNTITCELYEQSLYTKIASYINPSDRQLAMSTIVYSIPKTNAQVRLLDNLGFTLSVNASTKNHLVYVLDFRDGSPTWKHSNGKKMIRKIIDTVFP